MTNLKRFGHTDLGTYEYLEGTQGSIRLKEICSKDIDHIVCDIETHGKRALLNDILLIAFTYDGKNSFVFNPALVEIKPFLDLLRRVEVSNQRIKFDYGFLKAKYGVDLKIRWDTNVTHSLATAGIGFTIGGNSLDNLAERYLGVKLRKDLTQEFVKGIWERDELIDYAAADVLATWALIPVTEAVLRASGMYHIWEEIEKPLIPVLVDMELAGVNLDLEGTIKLRDTYQIKIDDVVRRIDEITVKDVPQMFKCSTCGRKRKAKDPSEPPCPECNDTKEVEKIVTVHLNPGSPTQLIKFFLDEGIEPPKKKRAGGKETYSTDDDSLPLIDHPVAKILVEHRSLQKKLTGYLIPLSTTTDEDPVEGAYNSNTGCIHTTFTQVDVDTGRMASQDPNVQNIPNLKEFRQLFVAPKGHVFCVSDYGQYELRVLCQLSNEKVMSKIFFTKEKYNVEMEKALEKIGADYYETHIGEKYPEIKTIKENIDKYDLHTQAAFSMFKLDPSKVDFDTDEWKRNRTIAKSINFAIPYGAGPNRVSSTSGVSYKDAEDMVKKYFASFPGIKKYLDETQKAVSVPMESNVAKNMGIKDASLVWVETVAGRKRFFTLPTLDNPGGKKIRAGIQREACNARIQGCVGGNTKILVKDVGYVDIASVQGNVEVWDGSTWSKALVMATGEKILCKITLTDNRVIECSPNHKFLISTTKNKQVWKTVEDLLKETLQNNRIIVTDEVPGWNFNIELPKSTELEKNSIKNSIPHNYRSITLNSISKDKDLGIWLGRLASDGTISSNGKIQLLVAEHEKEILDTLKRITTELVSPTIKNITKKNHKSLYSIEIYSKDLYRQLTAEDNHIKKTIPSYVFRSKELLSGYLKGFFDGDGGVSGSNIVLTFGSAKTKPYKESLAREIQQALLLFGVRSRLRIYDTSIRLQITKADSIKFCNNVGFIKESKNQKAKNTTRVIEAKYGRAVSIKSIEITNQTIPMYDVINSETGRFVANGSITHNSNADVTKLALVMLHNELKKPEYRGECLIRLAIHDEIVTSCPEDLASKVGKKQVEIMKLASSKYLKTVPTEVGLSISPKWEK